MLTHLRTVELEEYLILTMKRLQSAPVLRRVPPRFDLSRLESPRHAGSETAAVVLRVIVSKFVSVTNEAYMRDPARRLLAFACVSLSLAWSTSVEAALVGHWTFNNGTADDSSGSGNNGVLLGTPLPVFSNDVPSQLGSGQSLSLIGDDQHLNSGWRFRLALHWTSQTPSPWQLG